MFFINFCSLFAIKINYNQFGKGVVMSFIVTEPQKIEGTQLGFAVYPYQFNFQDFVEKDRKFNQKLLIFKMKNSPYIEIDKVLYEEKFLDSEVSRHHVNNTLKKFISENREYIVDGSRAEKFFERNIYGREEKTRIY